MASFHDFSGISRAIQEFQRQNESFAEAAQRALRLDDVDRAFRVQQELTKSAQMVLSAREIFARDVVKLPDFFAGVRDASSLIERMFRRERAVLEAIERSPVARGWDLSGLSAVRALEMPPDLPQLRSHLGRMVELSSLSEALLSGVPEGAIGRALRLDNALQGNIVRSSQRMANAYAHLLASVERAPTAVLTVPPLVTAMPVVEVFNDADLIVAISAPGVSEEIVELAEVRQAIASETQTDLRRLLDRLDPALLQLLEGAEAAFRQRGPDWVRHFATSLRELFTHVLHRLAPDENVRAWSSAQEHYSNGRPTRRARLLYICREINFGPFEDFIDTDVDSALECVGVFQGGTHAVDAGLNDKQVQILRARMESILRQMLLAAEGG